MKPGQTVTNEYGTLGVKIQLTQDRIALIDNDMVDRVSYFKWHAYKNGGTFYAATHINFNGKNMTFKMHQLILGFPGVDIDHKDKDGLNNQKYNLQSCTHQQNLSKQRIRTDGKSAYKGVNWAKAHNKWEASICCKKKRHHLGYYNNETDAAIAYNDAAIRLFGAFANLNVIFKQIQPDTENPRPE